MGNTQILELLVTFVWQMIILLSTYVGQFLNSLSFTVS